MASQSDIAANVISSLNATDPDLDTSVGTTTRKIIDAVAEQIAEAYVDSYLVSYQYDIDSKIGGDLDDFVGVFGIQRFPAKRASGLVTFSRVATTTAVTIPGIASISDVTGLIVVSTQTAGTMAVGVGTLTVPVQALNAGSSGNVAPNTLTSWQNGTLGVTVTNQAALSGGTDPETDAELRARWKITVFRSLAGTAQMYAGVALDNPNVTGVNVVSGSKRRTEQLQVPGSGGVLTSTVPDATFVFPSGVIVSDNLGNTLSPVLDYSWSTSIPPAATLSASGLVKAPPGTILNLSFNYTSTASRNDPTNGLFHRVDIWTAGSNPTAAVQSIVFQNATTFNNTSGPYLRTGWTRLDGTIDGGDTNPNPTNGNILIPLAFGPIISVPTTLTFGGTIYGLAGTGLGTVQNAYRIVHQNAPAGYASSSLFGLEWVNGSKPANNTVQSIAYFYNSVPGDVQAEVDRWRLLGVDALCHQAVNLALIFNVGIIYNIGQSTSSVNAAIDAAVSNWLAGISFNGTVQPSDALQVIHNVPGVDSVRFLRGSDYTGYVSGTPNVYHVGIQRQSGGATVQSYVDSTGRPYDVVLGDSQVPALAVVNKVPMASNSFGTA